MGPVGPELRLHAGNIGPEASRGGVSLLVDARGIDASGIGRYLREILERVFADLRFTRVTLLGDLQSIRAYCEDRQVGHRVSALAYSGGFYSPVSQLAWLRLRAGGYTRADVAFFPHYDTPMLALPRRSVVTVHDLTHFKVPDAFAAWRRYAAGMLLARSVAGAARVITGSEAARRDIVERFPSAAPKLRVIAHGVSPFFRKPGDSALILSELGLHSPYLLCVGNRKPHKNIVAAVETLARLRHDRPELILVLVGRTYNGAGEVRQRAEQLGVQGALVELPTVNDKALRALYAGCEVLLFPSLYEGFGLPVLEAMACGAPVIASNRASIPEVVGDAGILTDPDDYTGMADAVRRLTDHVGLRDELIQRGYKHAAKFSWDTAAQRTIDTLHEVAVLQQRAA